MSLTAGCADSEKVKEAITSPSTEAPSLRAGLLDEIALALDSTSRVSANWQELAIKLDVPRETYLELGRRSTQNPTNQLFQYFAASRPLMTLKILKEALHIIARKDLFNILQNLNGECAKIALGSRSEQVATKLEKCLSGKSFLCCLIILFHL